MEISNRTSRVHPKDLSTIEAGEDQEPLIESSPEPAKKAPIVSRQGLFVLMLLAVQNCFKNLLMRYVMKDQPQFLTSAAVLGSESLKLTLSVIYILLIQKKTFGSILQYLKEDKRNTLLLAVPASAYNFQMSMEYVALANINAALFSVLVQSKLLFTATFAALFLRQKLKYIQIVSLTQLTTGVMLCNLAKMATSSSSETLDQAMWVGISATLAIALSSGFASVYTEKVIKAQKGRTVQDQDYGLAYTQVQLALMSIVTIGAYAAFRDWDAIVTNGLFHNFSTGAFLSVASSALGGLIVAGVLKYADSVLKGYATALSVILTGVLSRIMFGTELNAIYFMGISNVVIAVILYNGGEELNRYVCS
ncbi:solute carrier family 35 (UDP-sugar transporter), member A1/2/3 [Fistulifera solaris]|uniref:Solute carrier family 35 (UDP-sugar transporter), member A1/2/3 n=1 Tax=Fistulifera solaris TaxID=1519565 RepID=A0A1Z5K9C0_FISSO|nr:solute carrier family 35 (UDP-sugar transporter), member A1/2/3 [Fistulifera solaris]|eukprot:GAX22883.1 solute carrier family 35 (UDP-sugar transporter), member A1/2/3 [Fistulifera solaris]